MYYDFFTSLKFQLNPLLGASKFYCTRCNEVEYWQWLEDILPKELLDKKRFYLSKLDKEKLLDIAKKEKNN